MKEKAVNKRVASGKARNLRKEGFKVSVKKSKRGYTVYYYGV